MVKCLLCMHKVQGSILSTVVSWEFIFTVVYFVIHGLIVINIPVHIGKMHSLCRIVDGN